MEYNSKHPCDLCNHSDNCDVNCVFYSYYSSYCSNYECIYHNSDIDCQYGKRCGSYIGLHHLSYALTTKKMMKKNTKHNERIEKLWQM